MLTNFNEMYFNINMLEERLDKKGFAKICGSPIGYRINKNYILNNIKEIVSEQGKYCNVYMCRDLTEPDEENTKYCRGIYAIGCNNEVSDGECIRLCSKYIKEHPSINREFSVSEMVSEEDEEGDNNSLITRDTDEDINESNEDFLDNNEDLNAEANNLNKESRIFGEILSSKYVDIVSKIEGVNIIKSVGNLGKYYFSAPSFVKAQLEAHPVNILPVIKSEETLKNYYIR